MSERLNLVHSLDDLRDFIHSQLCQKENLVPDQFCMRETGLVVRGRNCGLQFSLRGPRSIRLGAIWAADQNMLYFYDTRGQRYMKVRLKQRIFVEPA